MQFICDLLTQNVDKSAVVLQKILSVSDGNTVIYLYEVFHIIHAMVSIFKITGIKRKYQKYLLLYYIWIFLQCKTD